MRPRIERHPVMVRFTLAEHARIRATCPEGMALSVWVRLAAMAAIHRRQLAGDPLREDGGTDGR